MRSTNNQVATQFKRQADQASEASRAEIVAQAQLIDSEGQPSQFFYCSTIQPATAVTKALKARFTYVAASDEKPVAVSAEENKSTLAPQQAWKLETNLVTFSSNVLKVYALPSDDSPSIDLRLSTQFNGRILDVIKVPTLPFFREELQTTQTDVNEGKKPKKGPAANEQLSSARDVRNSRRKQRDIEEIIDTTEVKHVAELPQQQATQQFDPNCAPDYLFVILANFTVALVCYSKKEHKIEVVSRGNISEKILHDQKEPPYPIFLGHTGTFIVLMLYHNILKVIPLVKEAEGHQHIISLTHATAVRVRHSNVMQVVPLYQEGNPLQPTFGIVYQRTDHIRIPGQSGPPALSIKIELEKQLYDIEKRDLTPHVHNGGKLEFSSNSVYRVEPLSFGGFLAFDFEKVSYYRKELIGSNRAFHEKLKSAHSVTAFCQVDEFDNEKGATKTGVPFIRFLFATEAGELFMLAIQTEILKEVLAGSSLDLGESLINIEFLASKLTFCSSLVYLDDSLIFYSSKEGDSFVLKICAEHQGSQDQPYISIEQKFTSLAPIMDLQLARPENTQGQQSELVIVGGWNHQTNMNLVKQGVGLRSMKSFESILPSEMVQEYHSTGDLVLMRMYGYDQLIGIKVVQGTGRQGVINVDGFDVSRNFSIKPTEQILALSRVKLVHRAESNKPQKGQEEQMLLDLEENKQDKTLKAVVYATNTSIKVLDQAGEQFGSTLLGELPAEESKAITLVKLSGNKILIALQGGTLKHCQLLLSEDGTAVKFTGIEKLEMSAEISAMCIADDTELSLFYVTLFDAPHFSLNVLISSEGNLRVLARMPLASVLESTQTQKFYQHELVKGGYAFSQFSVSKKAVLLDLPNSAAQIEEKMDVDASLSEVKTHPKDDGITMQFNCSAARSIDHLTLKTQETDQILIGFANGKIMQVCLDLVHLKGIIEESFPPFLDFQAYVECRLSVESQKSDNDKFGKGHEDLNFEQAGPFWGAQLCYVGTIHPKMRKIKTEQGQEAVIACCDRPVVFYEANESIEMHYLAFTHIREISYLAASSEDGSSKRPFLLYEDKRGVLHLSENDNLRRLQVQRMVFKMQISKTLLIPTNDSIVVLLEQPNMDYIDSSKQACNAVGLVSRSTMRTQAIFQLQKGEIANCAYTIEPMDLTSKSLRKWLLVGTAFLNPEETIPSMGRLLMLEAETMQLIQVFSVGGSIQSILVTKENKFLLLGVNNMIQAYDFAVFMPTIRANTSTVTKLGKLDLLCQKTSGTFIQSIVKLAAPASIRASDSDLPESIIVGDMTGRGVSTFELKECRQTKVKIMESASTHIALWVNSIVALSESQFIVFDQDGNLFIFQKNLYPTCIEEKLKLTLKGSFCIGEEVQSATFGSLRSMAGQQITELCKLTDQDKTKQRQKKRKYVDGARKCTEAEQAAAEDQVMEAVEDKPKSESKKDTATMIVTRGSIIKQQQKSQEIDLIALNNPANFGKILKDIEYARKFAKKTLEEIFVLQTQKCSIIYGTTDGSIGSLFQITPKVYLLLQLLQHEMDQHVNLDLVQQKRSEYRQVKQTPATITELQSGKSILNGIIDGDLVEVFLELPKNKKVEFAKGMLGLSGKGDEEFTELLTQIVSLVKKAH